MAGRLHEAEAAARVGPGLIAEDLPEALPLVLRGLKALAESRKTSLDEDIQGR